MGRTLKMVFLTGFFILTFTLSLIAADWPQYMGPNRDGVWPESGVLKRFPDGGPKVEWRVPVGWGYAGPAVAKGRVYVMDYRKTSGHSQNNPGARDRLEGRESVKCFDAETGEKIWEYGYPRSYNLSFAGGPRCTPTVDGDRVYALGAEGDLVCLKTEDGTLLWRKSFTEDFGAEIPIWGVASHPLVHGERLYCVVGGEGSVAVAFNKFNGDVVWESLSAREQGYCPPTLIQQGRHPRLLVWHAEALAALDPSDGREVWSIPLQPDHGMSIAAPSQKDELILAAGYGVSGLIKLGPDGNSANLEWRGTTRTGFQCGTSTPLIEGDVAFGCDVNTGLLMCIRLADGERLWETREPTSGGDRRQRYATAFMVRNEDIYFLFNEKGELILADLSASGYKELERFTVLEPTNSAFGRSVVWSHPAFAQRAMFARNDKELVCVDLSAQ